MRSNWKRVSDLSIQSEGGYTNNPKDKGNWTGNKIGKGELKGTKYGIAANTYPALDIKNLTRAQAVAIYKKDYADPIGFDTLPLGMDYAVFDFAINSGGKRAILKLQEVLGVKPQGVMNGATRTAVEADIRPELLINKYMDARWAYMQTLGNFSTFKGGWKTRIADVRRAATAMAEGSKKVANAFTMVESNPGRADKAWVEDTKVSSALVAGKTEIAATTSGLSTVGATVSEMAEKIEPMSYYADWAQKIFIGLLCISMVVTLILLVKKKRTGAT